MVGVPSTVVHFLADLQSLHGFRCYDNIDACKLIALYTANAYSAEREIPASACTRCMAGLSKVVSFNLRHLQLAPPLGVTPFEFCRDLRHQKTRAPALSCGVVGVILRLVVS